MKNLCSLIFLIFFIGQTNAQFASWDEEQLILTNGIVERTIQLPNKTGPYFTVQYQPVEGRFLYFTQQNKDFRFEWNGKIYSGLDSWTLEGIENVSDNLGGSGVLVYLLHEEAQLKLTIRYLMYPGLPVIRKRLAFENLSSEMVQLKSVDVELFSVTDYQPTTFSWIYSDYGRRKSLGPYLGNMQDALLLVHHADWEAGIAIGNEASGVMKRTAVFWDFPEISSGLTHKTDRFPFGKWIKPGETFEAPQVFTLVYNHQKEPSDVLNKELPDFIRKHLGIRLFDLDEKPTFVYNTWEPFQKAIDEKLIIELADAAAAAGMKEFIIDDGWQTNYGDWEIDSNKFPNGLKPVFDHIKSLGMKPGLWLSVGSAAPGSKVYHEHPEWFVRDKDGEFSNLHIENDSGIRSACFSTGWKDYIRNILLDLINEHGLEYVKLDFAVVSSAYVFDNVRSGCYAGDHTGHQDHAESLLMNYQKVWELFDELHGHKPDLFIDCTFETMGGLQLIDYAMLQHAEGNWLSNFDGRSGEKTALRVRQMAWWRSPAIPATALVIGNPQMQDPDWELQVKSISGALPIMLGDPRALSENDLLHYRKYADWLQDMEDRHQVMSFRQDLGGFGEPMEGFWDGFQRVNTETQSGGIVGIFRQGALDDTRTVRLKYLNAEGIYQIKSVSGKVIHEMSGSKLEKVGFEVKLKKIYDGELFEVNRID